MPRAWIVGAPLITRPDRFGARAPFETPRGARRE
jgi:hypothetical protein